MAGARRVGIDWLWCLGIGAVAAAACSQESFVDLREASTAGMPGDAGDRGVADTAGVTADGMSTTVDVASDRVDLTGRYDGVWSGQTSQTPGQALTFIVSGGVLEWTYGWVLPACSSTTTITLAVPVPITETGQFTRTITAGAGGVSTTFTGRFETATSCTGTIDFELKAIPGVPSCSGRAGVTFTATR